MDAFCDSICRHIRGSRLIINDISAPLRQVCKECKKNDYVPSLNVYWEYGYAAGLGKTQIVICEENQFDIIPFDVGSKQILKYNTNNLEHVLQPLIEKELEKSIPMLNVINDSLDPIDITPRPDDEKIPILEVLIKNFTIKYYAEGYQSSINRVIAQLLDLINRYKPGYLERFAPNHSVAYQKIISYHFSNKYGKNLFPDIFQKKIHNGEIIPEEVPKRDVFTHAGDLAYVIYKMYNKDFKEEHILIDDARKEYQHIIQEKHEFFREGYRANTFQNILSILEKSGIIKTTGPYTGSDCKEKYEIRSLGRLQDFIQKYSLENLLKTL